MLMSHWPQVSSCSRKAGKQAYVQPVGASRRLSLSPSRLGNSAARKRKGNKSCLGGERSAACCPDVPIDRITSERKASAGRMGQPSSWPSLPPRSYARAQVYLAANGCNSGGINRKNRKADMATRNAITRRPPKFLDLQLRTHDLRRAFYSTTIGRPYDLQRA